MFDLICGPDVLFVYLLLVFLFVLLFLRKF
jgi:hypothetical protein